MKNKTETKKKVIFVAQALWLGGIETALVNLINHLDYERFDVTCLITENYIDMAKHINSNCRLMIADRMRTVSFNEAYKYYRLYTLMEKPAHASKFRLFIWKVLCLLLRGPEMRLYSSYIKKQMRNESFDTAVIYSDRVAEITTRSIDADRYLMFYHNADLGKAYHDTYGYRKSEKIIAVSEAQCEKLKELRSAFADKMIAIPNYIDVESVRRKADEEISDPVFEQKGIRLVSCGRLAPQKGFDIAIEACAKIVENGYDDLHWYILGVGDMKAELEKSIHEHKMEEHFHLLGSRSNPFPYMKAADLYVQPSRTEGYSLSILEARALACPTVATYSAAGEQLDNGVNGTLCETEESALTNAILLHLQDPARSERYRNELKQYSFEESNREILKIIETLL